MPHSTLTFRLLRSVRNRTRVMATRTRGELVRVGSYLGLLEAGRELNVGRNVDLDIYGKLILGNGVHLDDGCRLSVGPGAILEIGDRTYIGCDTIIRAASSVRIGPDTLIAEHCSIRDSDHELDMEKRVADASSPSTPVEIGRACWIAAGARILRGTKLGEGTVVAANAVVRASFADYSLLGGVPAKVIRNLR